MNRFFFAISLFSLLTACALVVDLNAQTRAPAPKPAPKATPPRPAPPRPAAAAPKVERQVPFKLGETLGYDISWSSFMTAATATVSVKEKKPSYDSLAYYIVAEGQPTAFVAALYKLYYKADTLLDAYTLLPQRGSLYVQEGKRHRMKTTLFNQTTRHAKYEVQTATHTEKDLALPGFTQDALSALYVLRSIPMKAGDKFNMPVTDAGDVYKVQIQVVGNETLKTPLGTLNALKIVPVISASKGSPPSGIAIWISDDARRLPLKIEAQLAVGKFVISLRKVTG